MKRKNILPYGSMFFPLRVAPMIIEINLENDQIEKSPKLNYTNMSNYVDDIHNTRTVSCLFEQM